MDTDNKHIIYFNRILFTNFIKNLLRLHYLTIIPYFIFNDKIVLFF